VGEVDSRAAFIAGAEQGQGLSAGDVVRSFIAAQATQDPEQAIRYLAPDVVFENVPFPPGSESRGADRVRAGMETWMAGATRLEWTIHRQVVDGDVVFHERTDEFWYAPGLYPGGDYCAFRVAAVWEVRGGLIELWRDYYDLGTIKQSLGVDLPEYSRIKREYIRGRS
jgi:limonene-1,2-epoxide hydrolase